MSHDSINSWVEKAKSLVTGESEAAPAGVRVIRHSHHKPAGNLIMQIADALRPWLTKMFDGVRDQDGLPVQQAHIRGMALNVAQDIVKQHKRG